MEHESGLNPARIQSDLTFNSAWAFNPSTNGYALGLAMMDGERRVNLLNFAKEQKKDWQAVPVQLEYMWNHDGSDSALLKRMSKSSDVNQLAVDILVHWERAGTKNDPNEQIKRKQVRIIGIRDCLQVLWGQVQPILVVAKLMC